MKDKNPIILFDGVCNLCNSSIDFILKRDKKKQFLFLTLQSKEGRELTDKFQIPNETDSVILILDNIVYIESDAALEISNHLPVPWNWTRVFKIVPKNLRNKVYRWVAKNRYSWFGKRDSCRVI